MCAWQQTHFRHNRAHSLGITTINPLTCFQNARADHISFQFFHQSADQYAVSLFTCQFQRFCFHLSNSGLTGGFLRNGITRFDLATQTI